MFCSYLVNLVIDVHMVSPPVSPPRDILQGASRTTGGVLRGRALGNVFNHADDKDNIYVGPRKGKVLVYQSPKDPMDHKPDMSITLEVAPRLKPVLKSIARKYSPVRSE
jgi:hypothetical protein